MRARWETTAALLAAAACAPEPPPPAVDATFVVDPAPADDPDASPYTGWTREHHVALFARLVVGHGVVRSAGSARTQFPGGELHPGSMEGSTRLLPALAAWLSNPDNPEVLEYAGVTVDTAELARDILVHGTDPDHPDYWGAIALGWDQRSVEAAAVADALLRAPDALWEPLSRSERDRVMAWLAATDDVFPNNWNLFVATRNLARKRLGFDYDEADLVAQLDVMDELYMGDGWYSDGAGAQLDYYNGFVIHPRLLAWAAFDGDADPARRTRVVRRARAYLANLPWLAADDGSFPVFGRSLAYRSAHLSALILAEELGENPLSPGLTRRLISGALRRDAGGSPDASDRAFADDHTLRVGVWGDDPRVRESYMAPGSHMFFAQAFGLLAFGPDHPVWTEVERPLPADLGEFQIALPGPGFALVGEGPGGAVTLLNAFSTKGDAAKYHDRYRKLAYSTHFPFNSVEVDGSFPFDSMVTSSFDGSTFLAREPSTWGAVAPGWMASRYTVGASFIDTATWSRGALQVRFACIEGTGTSSVVDSGFAVGVDGAPAVIEDQDGAPAITVQGTDTHVRVQALHGWDRVEAEAGFAGEMTVNAVHDAVWTVAARADAASPGTCFLAAHHAGAGVWVPSPQGGELSGITVDQTTRTAAFSVDGASVQLVASETAPETVMEVADVRAFGPLRLAWVDDASVVASGAHRVDDTEGLLVEADQALVVLHHRTMRTTTNRVVLVASNPGASLRVRSPFGAPRIWAMHPGGAVDITDEVALDGQTLQLDAPTWSRHASALGLTTITLELRGP